jgi:hypothetical protein
MPSLTDTSTRIAATGVPVLFLDTCSILDVIRAPVRGLAGCIEAASELVGLATAAPPRCSPVVGSFVPVEWGTHAQGVLDELTKHLDKMDQQAGHFYALRAHLGIALGFGRPRYEPSGLGGRLLDLSRHLHQAAAVLDPHPDTMSRAYDRVIAKRRPCRKGGELKDCTIFEECLEVCRQIQVGGFARKLIFCSSNTDDYCAPGMAPHPEIATDCSAVGLLFTTNLPWAVAELKT